MHTDQYPILTQALSRLSKGDLSNDSAEVLTGLAFLLEQATVNVAQALAANEREQLDMLRAENARLRAEVEVQGDWKRIAEARRAELATIRDERDGLMSRLGRGESNDNG